jgi:predicted MPP superfamily phosphohydrolase
MPIGRLLVFLAVLTSIIGGLHYYFWARLVRDPGLPVVAARTLLGIIVLLAATIPMAMLTMRGGPRAVAVPLSWLAFVWMGMVWLLFASLVGLDLMRGLARLIAPWTGTSVLDDPERRKAVARIVASIAGGAAAIGGIGGVVHALTRLAEKRVPVKIVGLSPKLAGFRIVQVTDIHVGPTIGKDFITEMVRRINALDPDVVAITGDLVDGSVEQLGAACAPLGQIRARHGVFFVTGNHEYYSGADDWCAHLSSMGIKVLRNERVTIERDGVKIDVAGVDDWSAARFGGGHGADLSLALAGRDPQVPVVLLAHQPKAIAEAARLGVALQLSGHTHAGQIFPFNFFVRIDQPYVSGLHAHGPTQIYVSPGTGYWGPPMRLGTTAEITILELNV